jgi:hypothetical protein
MELSCARRLKRKYAAVESKLKSVAHGECIRDA